MFSGIVEESGTIVELSSIGDGARLIVESKLDHQETKLGDSIAIDGVCLTVVKKEGSKLTFDLAEETLRKTVLGELKAGSLINLERSLSLGSRVHGHFVFGHVDTVAELVAKSEEGNSVKLEFKLETNYLKFLAPKGSISVSGVSLTIGEVSAIGFSVYIIPHTGDVTTLLFKDVGARVNIEIDMLARYVNRMLTASQEQAPAITAEFLTEHGFTSN
ncbi:MAG: riboflavin synthase [Bdellovibrionota bacterium]